MSWGPSFDAGQEGAEPDGLRRPLRISRHQRNLASAAAGVLVAGLLLMWMLSDGKSTGHVSPSPAQSFASPIPSGSVVVHDEPVVEVEARHSVSYAIALVELSGLPPDAAPGTRLDLWITWEPPVTREPRVQLLLHDVLLERIAQPVTRDGPEVAVLSVNKEQVGDLLYGDRFGSLSALVRPPQ